MSEFKAMKKWEAVDHEHYPGMMTIKGPSSPITIITSATDIDFSGHLQRVNEAHLIAASPELYEALSAIVKDWEKYNIPDENMSNEHRSALLALAKARGETQ